MDRFLLVPCGQKGDSLYGIWDSDTKIIATGEIVGGYEEISKATEKFLCDDEARRVASKAVSTVNLEGSQAENAGSGDDEGSDTTTDLVLSAQGNFPNDLKAHPPEHPELVPALQHFDVKHHKNFPGVISGCRISLAMSFQLVRCGTLGCLRWRRKFWKRQRK